MAPWNERALVVRDPVVDWCPRRNLSRMIVEIWVLTPSGMYKAGHGVDCGCYA